MKTIISLEGVSFAYHDGQEKTLDNVTFHVKQGEWLSIVGHNGSGKSTLVRLIDGLLEANEGRITVGEQVLSEETVWDIRKKIGMVFQNPDNQFVGATVEDDVAFGLENQGLAFDEMKKRVYDALELVGMTDFADREPARLSGGQKQRVAIAGIVAMQPEILILDEATSMLDPEGRLELMKTIQTVRKEHGMTIISITHDLDEVALSDRVLVMKKGQVAETATPEELLGSGEQALSSIGLDTPFAAKLLAALDGTPYSIDKSYANETELGDDLWALLSNM